MRKQQTAALKVANRRQEKLPSNFVRPERVSRSVRVKTIARKQLLCRGAKSAAQEQRIEQLYQEVGRLT